MMGTYSNNCKQQQKVQKHKVFVLQSSANITAVSVFIVSWCHNSAAPLLAWFWAKSSVTFKLRNLRWAKLIGFKATATVRYRWASAKVITHPVMTTGIDAQVLLFTIQSEHSLFAGRMETSEAVNKRLSCGEAWCRNQVQVEDRWACSVLLPNFTARKWSQ